MALTHVRAKVGRPNRAGRSVSLRLLVDTGAVYTVLPEKIWRGLQLKPERRAEFTLADGTTISRGVSECRFTVGRDSATSPVVLGGPEDAALLGAVTLETLGLMVNPLSRKLLPMRLMLAGWTSSPADGPGVEAGPGLGRAPTVRRAPRRAAGEGST